MPTVLRPVVLDLPVRWYAFALASRVRAKEVQAEFSKTVLSVANEAPPNHATPAKLTAVNTAWEGADGRDVSARDARCPACTVTEILIRGPSTTCGA